MNGATTIWERWDGWRDETGFQDPLMNSFNHFALGSVGEWLYGYVAGLRSAAPGYAHLHIEPQLNRVLGAARASTESIRGRASVEWVVAGDRVTLDVEIPANTTATVVLPCVDVTESGVPVTSLAPADSASVRIEIGSGSYRFGGTVVGTWSPEGALVAP
jgi:alpha-L-rhamnosidase